MLVGAALLLLQASHLLHLLLVLLLPEELHQQLAA
jgi:hypothetical protein